MIWCLLSPVRLFVRFLFFCSTSSPQGFAFCGTTGACCSFKGCEWSTTLTAYYIAAGLTAESKFWQNVFEHKCVIRLSTINCAALCIVNIHLFHCFLRLSTSVVTVFECSLIYSVCGHNILLTYTEWKQTLMRCVTEDVAHFTAFKNSVFCCVSVCGESLSSLRRSSAVQQQLFEMIITQTASELPS